jgi:hypothetical protein
MLDVSHSSLLSLGRYVVIALAIVALAPYAGCHILTSPPNPVLSADVTNREKQKSKNGEPSGSESEERSQRASSADEALANRDVGETNLSEIETLLREP